MLQTAIYFGFLLVYVSLPIYSTAKQGCTISINKDLTAPSVLILKPGYENGNDAFYLPTDKDNIKLAENQQLTLACPGGKLKLGGSKADQTAQAKCTSGKFLIKGKTYAFSAFTCSEKIISTIRATGEKCLSKYQEVEIGFQVEERFLRQILICFDRDALTTLYSEYNLTKTIGGYQVATARPSWPSRFFNVKEVPVKTLYTRKRQRLTINALLGLLSCSKQYIKEKGHSYLSIGHLTAKTDFIYDAQQRSTFYYVNTAPQWQSFNAQNWFYMERNVRDFASKRGLDLIVYTGTYGVTSLPHDSTKQEVELYLYVDGETRGIPVPRLFWKLLYEPITKAGVVFVGVNNPYSVDDEMDKVCKDICSQYKWLTWKPSNITRGYSYCCSVDDFKKTVKTLPNIEVVKLLT